MPTTKITVVDFNKLHLAEQPTGAHTVLAVNGTELWARSDSTLYAEVAPNIVPPHSFFDQSHDFQLFNLKIGRTYRWIKGTHENNGAQNGLQSINNTGSPGQSVDFVALYSPIIFFSPTVGAPVDLMLLELPLFSTTGTITTPPLFMYLNSRITAFGITGTVAPAALLKWTDYGNTAAQQAVDVSPLPSIEDTITGTLLVPARGNTGLIEFQESGTLLPGQYRLIVESGNIGRTDSDFNGFDVEVTINSKVLEEKLLVGQKGFNIRGFDQFDFTVTDKLIGSYLISFLWTNPFSNPSTGAERQLAIYSYTLRRLATELYEVTLAGSTAYALTKLDTTNYTSGTTPGGWFLTLNSYGTLATYAHESLVYSANDTIVSNEPISNVLTGVTCEKREDILLPQVDVITADSGSFTYPALGALSPTYGATWHQTGEIPTFSIPTPAGTAIYSYVWKWWDNTSTATSVPTTSKELNIGGVPSNGSLAFSVTPVALDGQAHTVYGAMRVNNPPVIVPSPTISVNDTFVPYDTRLSLFAFDFENNLPLMFVWSDANSSVILSNAGTNNGSISVVGTWVGNGTTIINNYTAFGNYFDVHVVGGQTVRCDIVDSNSGTTFVDFSLRGYNRPPPASGIAAAANFEFTDSSALPIKRVGAGQFFDFEVDARDLTGSALTFQWNFAGTNNWTVPSFGAGTTTLNPDGSYRSVYQKDLSGEIISFGTSKVAVAECRVTNGTSRSDVSINVVLLKNNPPSSITVTARDAITGIVFSDLNNIPAGSMIELDGVPSDLDNDVVTLEWGIALTGSSLQIGTAFPLSYDVMGGKVIVSTVGATAGLQITGNVTATDRVGGTDTISIPTMTLS